MQHARVTSANETDIVQLRKLLPLMVALQPSRAAVGLKLPAVKQKK